MFVCVVLLSNKSMTITQNQVHFIIVTKLQRSNTSLTTHALTWHSLVQENNSLSTPKSEYACAYTFTALPENRL